MNRLWVRDYIGLEWKAHGRDRAGVDCWGLYKLVLQEQLEFALPNYLGYVDTEDRPAMADIVSLAQQEMFVRVIEPRQFDLVLLRVLGLPVHVGLYIGYGEMLHVMKGTNSAVEPVHGPSWQHRLDGYWRPKGI